MTSNINTHQGLSVFISYSSRSLCMHLILIKVSLYASHTHQGISVRISYSSRSLCTHHMLIKVSLYSSHTHQGLSVCISYSSRFLCMHLILISICLCIVCVIPYMCVYIHHYFLQLAGSPTFDEVFVVELTSEVTSFV